MSSRKEELLAKKTRLAELKRQRELRQGQLSSGRLSIGGETPSPRKTVEERRIEIDDLVSSLIDRQRDSTASPSRERLGSFQSVGDVTPNNGFEKQQKPPMQSVSTQTTANGDTQTDLPAPPIVAPAQNQQPRKEYITYTKGVQTDPYVDAIIGTEEIPEEIPSPRTRKRLSRIDRERDEEIRKQLKKEIEEELKATQAGISTNDLASSEQRFPLRQLTDTELNAVTSSNEFLSFIERSSKVIERALDDDYDLLADYTRASTLGDDDDDPYSRSRKAHSVQETQQFFSERHSRRRMITDLNFSPHFNELLLTSYTKNPSAPNEPAGLVLLWNVHSPSRPEYVFTAGTDVLSARFSPFHPNLVIGGCYSGQICLWDTRQSGRNGQPVQKTPQSGSHLGHTHPVYNISIVGTQNAHNIMTASMDGVVCSWSFDMLSQAQEYLELRPPQQSPRTDDIAPTCMSFPVSDPTFFLVGTEEGNIHPCHRYDRAGAKAGIDSRLIYSGHTAPIMSTQFHPGRGPVDLGDLVLSSSSDWSIKLWRVKPAAASNTAAAVINQYGSTGSGSNRIDPILDIQSEDLVYDAKWSPHKPSVFAAVTGAGELDVYDLNYDTEVPVAKVSPTRGAHGVVPFKGLNKVVWEERKGSILATGGLDGMVTLFEVGRGLRCEPSEVPMDEWTSMKKLVARLESESLRSGSVA